MDVGSAPAAGMPAWNNIAWYFGGIVCDHVVNMPNPLEPKWLSFQNHNLQRRSSRMLVNSWVFTNSEIDSIIRLD